METLITKQWEFRSPFQGLLFLGGTNLDFEKDGLGLRPPGICDKEWVILWDCGRVGGGGGGGGMWARGKGQME